MIGNNLKNFVGICVLTASLAFGFWGCSDSGSSSTSCNFEYGDDETQITGYTKKGSGSCPTDIEIPDGVTHIAEERL